MPGAFTEMPFDTKSHLINYHTEGQGENTDVPLINMQTTQIDGNMLNLSMGGTQISNMDLQQHTEMSREIINGYYQGYGASQMEGTWRGLNLLGGSTFQSEYMSRERETGIFDGMALPYHYLGQYYNQKMQSSEAQTGKDNLLVYDYEGQGSSAGSLGSCSSLDLDKDLHFLDDLDFKFKTLADICGGKNQAEVRAPAPPTTTTISTSIRSHTGVSSVVVPGPLSVPTSLPIPKAEVISSSSEVQESSEHTQTITNKEVSKEASRGVAPQPAQVPQAPQGQMLLLQQQPQLYYTTAPVLQPMHYMVQPPVQNTVLLREAPGPNMQGVMLVNGPENVPAQGLVMQGQTVMQGQAVGQTQVPGMVLVEKVQGPGASLSSSQTMMLVGGKGLSGSKQVLKKVQPELSGSQPLLVVGSGSAQRQQTGVKSSLSGGLLGSQRALNKSSSSGTQNITGNSIPSSSRRVVVQETREVIQTNL